MSDIESTSPDTIEETGQTPESTKEVKDNSMGDFYQLKNKLLIGTIVVAVVGSSLTWFFLSGSTSLNYLLGTCFGLVYLNMLAKSVEEVGGDNKGSGLNRLALFVGVMLIAIKRQELQVLPIFLGFITYKVTILLYILPSYLLGDLNKSE